MANDVFEAQIVGACAGEPAECVVHWELNSTEGNSPTTATTALANLLASSFNPVWLPCLPDDYILFGYKCRRVNNTGGPTSAKPTAGSPGSRGASSVSSGQGPVIVWNYVDTVAMPNRWRTGRTFLPGIAEGDLSGNVLLPALVTAVEALIAFMAAGMIEMGGRTWTHVLWSRKNLVAIPPNAGVVSGVIGTQRRRLHPAL